MKDRPEGVLITEHLTAGGVQCKKCGAEWITAYSFQIVSGWLGARLFESPKIECPTCQEPTAVPFWPPPGFEREIEESRDPILW